MQPLHSAQQASRWLRERVRGRLLSDSRQLRPGDGFIAWPGQATDARRFVRAALDAGAAACLVEQQGLADFDLPLEDERLAALPQLKAASGEIAAGFHGHPGARLQVVAVTGTNGKSSTAWWTAQALGALGRRCALVGTLGIGEPPVATGAPGATGTLQSTGLTTPDAVTLQAGLRDMVDAGFAACAIEASSIGIAEHRLAGTPIAVAQFSNLTRDHLDYHGDMATYWACKRALFATPGLRAAVINIDDAQGAQLARELSDTALDVWTVSMQAPARLAGRDLRHAPAGLAFDLAEGDARSAVQSGLIGDFNASNLLLVLGALRALGFTLAQAAGTVAALGPVPGRMQRVAAASSGGAGAGPEVVVDYAHTPDALDKAIAALRPWATARGGRLWCVFGCGGNRDSTKRPLMGAIAQRGADAVLLTSDNPRRESPHSILEQIAAGMAAQPAPQIIVDRRAAIEQAITQAARADVVLVAGKGHETTQDIGGVSQPFSDVLVARSALQQRGACA